MTVLEARMRGLGTTIDTALRETDGLVSATAASEAAQAWAEYERMRAHGVRFRSEPVAIEAGINKGGFTCYFLDPDDITLEIIQAPTARNS